MQRKEEDTSWIGGRNKMTKWTRQQKHIDDKPKANNFPIPLSPYPALKDGASSTMVAVSHQYRYCNYTIASMHQPLRLTGNAATKLDPPPNEKSIGTASKTRPLTYDPENADGW
jgi:hypothetical protein